VRGREELGVREITEVRGAELGQARAFRDLTAFLLHHLILMVAFLPLLGFAGFSVAVVLEHSKKIRDAKWGNLENYLVNKYTFFFLHEDLEFKLIKKKRTTDFLYIGNIVYKHLQ